MARVGRTLGLTGLTLGAAAGLLGAGALAAMRRALPRTQGSQALPGLQARVEVIRDAWGVPHIYAAHEADLFAALGYVHAQDRLWQMELNRRTGHGQLAEVLGPIALETDRFVRTLGFGRVARRDAATLDAPTRAVVTAYVHGINTFLATQRSRLPIEFVLLRHTPRPWTIDDVLAWSKVIGYSLSGNWTFELLHAHLVATLGPQRARALRLNYPDQHPLTIPPGVGYAAGVPAPHNGLGTRHDLHQTTPFLNGHQPGQGSNAWAVSGARSTTGKPLLANDPHLAASMPTLWYEAHLEGGAYQVAGAMFPGLPSVLIGHNAHFAWGVTNAMIDVQDLFVERLHPTDPLRYATPDGWQPIEVVHEEIAVRGRRDPVVETVHLTRHGPIISHLAAPPDSALRPPDTPQEVLALRWTALESTGVATAAVALNRAQNWDEFRAALADWDVPAQNFIYADQAGHIGYLLAGRLPQRAQDDGQLPVPGWDGAHEWVGFLPPDELPHSYDPPTGMLINANNKPMPDDAPHAAAIQGEWLIGYRAQRIATLLDSQPTHDVASFARIQSDLHCAPGLELAALLAHIPPPDDPLAQQASTLLTDWDGMLTAESAGGAVYARLRYHLEREALAAYGALRNAPVGWGLMQQVPASEMLNRRALPTILTRIAAAPLPDRPDPWLSAGHTWHTVLHASLKLAVADLCRTQGNQPQRWRYGTDHRLRMRHVLGDIPLLGRLLNRGPWPTGGDLDTICAGYMPGDYAIRQPYIGPLYRQICDTADWDNSVSVLLGGQSGQPLSPHYCDMHALWKRNTYHPMLWSRERVLAHAAATLLLEPEDQTHAQASVQH